MWRELQDDGVLVYGLHGGERDDLLADFVEQTGVTFPIIDARGTRNSFNYPPGSRYPYPRDVVIGPDLVVRSIRNSFNLHEMRELVRSLLAQR